MKVENLNKKSILDLIDSTCSHYLVTGGDMKFYVSTGEKNKIIKCFYLDKERTKDLIVF